MMNILFSHIINLYLTIAGPSFFLINDENKWQSLIETADDYKSIEFLSGSKEERKDYQLKLNKSKLQRPVGLRFQFHEPRVSQPKLHKLRNSKIKLHNGQDYLLRLHKPKDYQLKLSKPVHNVDADNFECGIKKSKDHAFRIIDGEETEINEFPWMTSIVFFNASNRKSISRYLDHCGGTLISNEWVITAAHCFFAVKKPEHVFITLGEHDRTGDATHKFKTTAAQYFINPYYEDFYRNQIMAYNNYDVALIKLKEPVDQTRYHNIRSICLPEPDDSYNDKDKYVNKRVLTAGWGHTETGVNSPVLLKASLIVYNNSLCESILGIDYSLTDFRLCAGENKYNENGTKDTCQNDSGGPLMHKKRGKKSLEIIGVISYGKGPLNDGKCGRVGVYVRVSMHLTWIYQTMTNNHGFLSTGRMMGKTIKGDEKLKTFGEDGLIYENEYDIN